jgi:homogentisate 1,2-dioxygenase
VAQLETQDSLHHAIPNGRESNSAAPFSAHPLGYQRGFGSEFATEALPGALPVGRNSPQRAAYGLYAEQFSGTAFTAPRSHNRRSWLYRIRPAAVHQPFTLMETSRLVADFSLTPPTPPNQLRWDPLPMPSQPTDFVEGMVTMAGNGSAETMSGSAIHVYAANRSMEPQEIAVIPRGLRFQ